MEIDDDNAKDDESLKSLDDSSDDEAAVAAQSGKRTHDRLKKTHFDPTLPNNSTSTKKNKSNNQRGTPNPDLRPMNTFKPIDHQSKHRRECTRLNDTSTSDLPQSGNAKEYLHQYKTRISVKVNTPPSDKPETTLMQRIKEFVTELISTDDSLVIFPWKNRDYGKCAIEDAEDVTLDIRKFKIFTKKLWASKPNTAATNYFQLLIGHDNEIKDIRYEMRDWLQQGQHGLYEDMLQADDAIEIGWLLYSTQVMDAGALADEIMEAISPLKIGLRWKKINTGSTKKVPDSKVVKALNVEGSMRHKSVILQKLHQYLGSTKKPAYEYPNGIRLRFVKNKADTVNPTEKAKIDKLRDRQKSFTRDILTATIYDIVQLDYATKPGNPTLRQMIMSINSTYMPTTPLFHAVDLDWKGEGYAFQFSPDMGEEAACIINTLIPYLNHFFPTADVESFFTEDAQKRCETMKFDTNKSEVIDTAAGGTAYEFDIGEDDELGGFSFKQDDNLENEVEDEILRVARPPGQKTKISRPNHFPGDTDSVSTFGGGRLSKAPGFNPSPKQLNSLSLSQPSNDATSVSSSISGVTMKTIQTLESKFDKKFDSFDEKFFSMMNLLQQTLQGQKSTSSEESNLVAIQENQSKSRESESSPGKRW